MLPLTPRLGIALTVAPALLTGVVVACDALIPLAKPNIPLTAMLDEPAHLATSALVLTTFAPSSSWGLLPGTIALASSVLIDVDHVPLYLGLTAVAPSGRPVTHSAVAPLALMTLAALLPRSARRAVRSAALGVGLHLIRDLATGPGVSLFWPLDARSVLLPYSWYAGAVGLLGATGTIRLALRSSGWRRRQ
jgi:inner membrane protein